MKLFSVEMRALRENDDFPACDGGKAIEPHRADLDKF